MTVRERNLAVALSAEQRAHHRTNQELREVLKRESALRCEVESLSAELEALRKSHRQIKHRTVQANWYSNQPSST